MIAILNKFFHMGGYEFYILTAYGSVLLFLLIQWLLPWRRWQTYLRNQQIPVDHHE